MEMIIKNGKLLVRRFLRFLQSILIYFMGQQTSHSFFNPILTDRSLSFIAEPTQSSSSLTKQKAYKTVTVTSIDQLNLLKEMFDFRLKYRNYLTHCYGFEVIDANSQNLLSKITCKTVLSSIKVNFYYQIITQKFSDLYQISIQQGFKLLAHCLQAYSILYDQFGYFIPESRQINKQGQEWKVWINQNIFALKSKSKKPSTQSHSSKQKFLQQVIHLFDSLRDDLEPQFSYSVFIYGSAKNNKFLPSLQLKNILELLKGPIQQGNFVKKYQHRASLKRIRLESNQTLRRLQCDTLISFDEKANEITLPNFNHKKKKHINMSLHQSRSVQDSQKQNVKLAYKKIKGQTKHQSFNHGYENSSQYYNPRQKFSEDHYRETSQFRRVSSKFTHETTNNDHLQLKLKHQYHKKNSTASTPSNCTGWTKNMKPLQMLCNKLKNEISMHNGSFIKKDRSHTVDYTNIEQSYFQPEISQQPIRITENSEVNSDSEQIYLKDKKFDHAFLQSERTNKSKEHQKFVPVQIISKNPTSHNSPSIAHKARKCGKETMKLLKEYFMIHSKGDHRRSLTDHACLQTQNKIKYCWSQELDSEFLSIDSKTPSKPQYTSDHLKTLENEHVSEQSQEEETSNRELDRKKKILNITLNDGASVFSYNQKNSDGIFQNSSGYNQQTQCGASMGKLQIFKSNGFKSLLFNNHLNTLNSIKQIEFDQSIDDEILKDMNKMFKRHRFAKSTKLTKLQNQY